MMDIHASNAKMRQFIEEKQVRPTRSERWLAWYPVRLTNSRIAWLEYVTAEKYEMFVHTHYDINNGELRPCGLAVKFLWLYKDENK